MDPRLVRLFEEGDKDTEVAAILRLKEDARSLPAGVRVVSQFGRIATIRVRRGHIPSVHDAPAVASMKIAGPLLREARVPSNGAVSGDFEARRPRSRQVAGHGVVVGLVDWGFDFAHPDFRSPDGATRLLAMWDQSLPAGPASPDPYGYGIVHTTDAINAALGTSDPYAALNYWPADSDDDGGGTHGTHVAGIAVGNGRAGGPAGVAPKADIVFVQLTTFGRNDSDLADAATMLEAIDFIRGIAGSRPWVVNLSMGQCGDQHDGTTLVEQGFDALLAQAPGRAIVQSTGNYFASRMHSSGRLRSGERRTITWRIPASSDTNELEVWYSGGDAFTVALRAPDGTLAGRALLGERVPVRIAGKSRGVLHNRRRDPNNFDNHVVLWLWPGASVGNWKLVLDGTNVTDGRFHVWVQRGSDAGPDQACFPASDANPFFTTNSICNGRRTIAVGAYDAQTARRDVAAFSSAGPTRDGRPKPDLLAPGVNILSARSTPAGAPAGSGQLVRMTGTSMAAPHVAGTVALMFEAAPRLLSSEETLELLLSSTQLPDRSAREMIRYGRGYLDIDAAIGAARSIGNASSARVPTQAPVEAAMGSAPLQPAKEGWFDPLAMADSLIGIGGAFAVSPPVLLTRVLSVFGDRSAVDALAAAGLLDPAALFDCFAGIPYSSGRPALDRLFAVVAYPRQHLSLPLCSGDLLLRRALGEPGLGHAALIADSDACQRDEAQLRGLSLEGQRPGLYARVVEAGSRPHRLVHRFARRIASPEGQLPPDTLILRPQLATRPLGASERQGRGAVPAAPPAAVAGWRLGVDFAGANALNDAAFVSLKTHDKVFAVVKCSQGVQPDTAFPRYYRMAREHGLIRGSYHFFANKRARVRPQYDWNRGSIAEQAALVASQVPPLLPGDLAPALDLEDEPRNAHTGRADEHGRYPLDQGLWPDESGYHYRAAGHLYPDHGAAGRREILTDIQDFLDRIETAFGRVPLVYTSHMWRDTDMLNNPADPDPSHPMSNYPLWTVYHGERDLNAIAVGGWGRNWMFIQYAEQGSDFWGMAAYREPGINVPGIDFNAFKPSMHQLRGLADIGRLGITNVGPSPWIASVGLDDHLRVLAQRTGADQDLTTLLARNSGDPALLATAADLFVYFRDGDHLVEATAPIPNTARWQATDIEDSANGNAVKPVHDPRAVISDNRRHVVYVGDDFDWRLLISTDVGWWRSGGVLANAGLRTQPDSGRATGQPAVYVMRGVTHIVGRVDQAGHLFDVSFDGMHWAHDDITSLARDLAPDMPGATYSPCVYETSSGVAVVFRAVRGDLWVITRSDNAPTNLMDATQTPGTRAIAASGHPTCFVLRDVPHVVYRAADAMLYDIWLEAGSWHLRPICAGDAHKAVADPAAASGTSEAFVAFRGSDDQIHTARFDGVEWTCSIAGS